MPEPTQVFIQHFGAKDSGWDPTRVLWVDVLLLRVNALLRDIKSIIRFFRAWNQEEMGHLEQLLDEGFDYAALSYLQLLLHMFDEKTKLETKKNAYRSSNKFSCCFAFFEARCYNL